MMITRHSWHYVVVAVSLCLLLAAMSGCDSSTPAPSSAPPSIATDIVTPTVAPIRTPITSVPTSVTSEPTATTCATPSVVGKLELMTLPGAVRAPSALAWFKGRIAVAGHQSNNVGFVSADQLTNVLPVGAGPTSVVADENLGKVFVLNAAANTVSMTDGAQVQATIPLTGPTSSEYQQPTDMVGDPQTHRLFVAITSSRSEIAVIDTQTFKVSARVALNGVSSVGRLAIDRAHNQLLVSHYDALSVFNLQTNALENTIKLPGSSYRTLLVDEQSGHVFVEYYKDGSFLAVLENGKQVAAVPIGADPYDAALANGRVYVSNSYSNTVSVIDVQTNQLVTTIDVGLSPHDLLADPSRDRMYVTVVGTYGHEFNRIEIIDTKRNLVTGIIPLAATAQQLSADNTRNRLYALLPSSNQLLISDGQRVLSSASLERAPFQMALDEVAGKLYVTDFLARVVSVVDVTNGNVVMRQPVNVSRGADAIAVDKARNRLLVNNRTFSSDQLAATGQYSIVGYTLPYGAGITPDVLLTNPSVPRFYAVASNGVPGSNGGNALYLFDSETVKQLAIVGDRNISALVLDDATQRLYETATHPLAYTTKLSVFDALSLNRISTLDLPTRVTAMALNPQTHHLFMSYVGYSSVPNAADNTIEILDTRTLGRVGAFAVGEEPFAMATLGNRVFLAHSADSNLTIMRDCAGDAPPAPTPTLTPTPYPTFPPLPTFTATRATLPTPTVAAQRPTPKPSPLVCANGIAGWVQANFSTQAALSNALERLGCPLAPPRTIQFAMQAFQKGVMIWRPDTRKIYVLNYNNTWTVYDDIWDASQPEGGTEKPPAPNLSAPKRGFGKVWREKLGGASATLGWAVETERSLTNETQDFQRGVAFKPDQNFVGIDVLFADGTWL